MTTLSAYYDASFAGVEFFELFDGLLSAAEPPTKTKEAILEIPGGNVVVYQDFGRAARTFDLNVGVDATELALLKGKRGLSGALVSHMGTITARLRHVDQVQWVATTDSYRATLSFVQE